MILKWFFQFQIHADQCDIHYSYEAQETLLVLLVSNLVNERYSVKSFFQERSKFVEEGIC